MAKTTENKVIDPMEEKVTILLPKYRGGSTDEYITVNHKKYLIQRGVQVSVPRAVALALRQREKMLDAADAFNESVKNG